MLRYVILDALYWYITCGLSRLDRDNDGIPKPSHQSGADLEQLLILYEVMQKPITENE